MRERWGDGAMERKPFRSKLALWGETGKVEMKGRRDEGAKGRGSDGARTFTVEVGSVGGDRKG